MTITYQSCEGGEVGTSMPLQQPVQSQPSAARDSAHVSTSNKAPHVLLPQVWVHATGGGGEGCGGDGDGGGGEGGGGEGEGGGGEGGAGEGGGDGGAGGGWTSLQQPAQSQPLSRISPHVSVAKRLPHVTPLQALAHDAGGAGGGGGGGGEGDGGSGEGGGGEGDGGGGEGGGGGGEGGGEGGEGGGLTSSQQPVQSHSSLSRESAHVNCSIKAPHVLIPQV